MISKDSYRILVVSDTHGSSSLLRKCIALEEPFDMLIHCGDVEGQEEEIRRLAGCETHIVSGNNDYFTSLPREEEFSIGKYRAFLTHGHSYGVSLGLDRIVEEAKERGADTVIFGHIHRPVDKKRDGVRILNPGSLTYPRQEGRRPSYAALYVYSDGEAIAEIKYL